MSKELEEKFLSLIDGTIPALEAEKLWDRIEADPALKAAYEAYDRVLRAERRIGAEQHSAPEHLSTRIMAAIEEQEEMARGGLFRTLFRALFGSRYRIASVCVLAIAVKIGLDTPESFTGGEAMKKRVQMASTEPGGEVDGAPEGSQLESQARPDAPLPADADQAEAPSIDDTLPSEEEAPRGIKLPQQLAARDRTEQKQAEKRAAGKDAGSEADLSDRLFAKPEAPGAAGRGGAAPQTRGLAKLAEPQAAPAKNEASYDESRQLERSAGVRTRGEETKAATEGESAEIARLGKADDTQSKAKSPLAEMAKGAGKIGAAGPAADVGAAAAAAPAPAPQRPAALTVQSVLQRISHLRSQAPSKRALISVEAASSPFHTGHTLVLVVLQAAQGTIPKLQIEPGVMVTYRILGGAQHNRATEMTLWPKNGVAQLMLEYPNAPDRRGTPQLSFSTGAAKAAIGKAQIASSLPGTSSYFQLAAAATHLALKLGDPGSQISMPAVIALLERLPESKKDPEVKGLLEMARASR